MDQCDTLHAKSSAVRTSSLFWESAGGELGLSSSAAEAAAGAAAAAAAAAAAGPVSAAAGALAWSSSASNDLESMSPSAETGAAVTLALATDCAATGGTLALGCEGCSTLCNSATLAFSLATLDSASVASQTQALPTPKTKHTMAGNAVALRATIMLRRGPQPHLGLRCSSGSFSLANASFGPAGLSLCCNYLTFQVLDSSLSCVCARLARCQL